MKLISLLKSTSEYTFRGVSKAIQNQRCLVCEMAKDCSDPEEQEDPQANLYSFMLGFHNTYAHVVVSLYCLPNFFLNYL